MTQEWKEVWNRRTGSESLDLGALLRLDGFDSGAGQVQEDDWRIYAAIIGRRLGLEDHASVFEVGCGAGAFLYALREHYPISVGGIDYAAGLVGVAREAMPDGSFEVTEAADFPVEPQVDHVISNGVFHYFDRSYAHQVLERMVKKAKRRVAVLDVPDLATRDEAEALRRDALTQEAYEEKYRGLEHIYYSREWFQEWAAAHGCGVDIFDGCLPNYAQAPYRFGCILHP